MVVISHSILTLENITRKKIVQYRPSQSKPTFKQTRKQFFQANLSQILCLISRSINPVIHKQAV